MEHIFVGVLLSVLCVAANQPEPYRVSHVLNVENMKNKIATDYFLSKEEAISKLKCADRCMNSENCFSFFYNKNSKICQTHGNEMDGENDSLVGSNGFRYYRISSRRMVGENCKDSPECNEDDTECAADGRCACTAGYSYDHVGKQCKRNLPIDCYDLLLQGKNQSGVYTVYPPGSSRDVYCDQDTDGGGWLVFQRRCDGSENFYRGWDDYEQGFGTLAKEFWIGNEFLANVTVLKNYTLRIDLESFANGKRYAQHPSFWIGSSSTNYMLHIGEFSGTVEHDGLQIHDGQGFTTKDRDNDAKPSTNCANQYKGAWWYKSCHYSHLNGVYHGPIPAATTDGVTWRNWLGLKQSLKTTEMKFRPTHI